MQRAPRKRSYFSDKVMGSYHDYDTIKYYYCMTPRPRLRCFIENICVPSCADAIREPPASCQSLIVSPHPPPFSVTCKCMETLIYLFIYLIMVRGRVLGPWCPTGTMLSRRASTWKSCTGRCGCWRAISAGRSNTAFPR